MDENRFITAKSSREDSPAEEMEASLMVDGDQTVLAALISFMAVIIALGSIGNILVILAVAQSKKLQTVSNTFVANLSICDLMFVTVVLPVNMYTYLGNGWHLHAAVCKFIGFLGYTLTGTTIMTITLIAWNRYKLVVDVSQYKTLFRPRNMALMISATWIIPALCIQPAVFGKWGHFGYIPMLSSCNLGLDSSSQSFKIFLLIVRAAIPCGLIIYYYSAIYATTRASHQRLHHTSFPASNIMRQHNHRREMRLTRMMIGIFVVFVLSYFPCTISSVIDWSRLLSNTYHMFCQTSVFLGSAINPLLYGFMNEQFRSAYYQILTCKVMCFRRRHAATTPKETTHADNTNDGKEGHNYEGLLEKSHENEPMNKDKFYLRSEESESSTSSAAATASSQWKKSWNEYDTLVHSGTCSTNLFAPYDLSTSGSRWLIDAETEALCLSTPFHSTEEVQKSSV